MRSPFDEQSQVAGPQITPQSMNSTGRGGQQNPSYLQTRKPSMRPMDTNGSIPMITPRAEAPGDTVRAPEQPQASGPAISPPTAPVGNGLPPQTPQAGGGTAGAAPTPASPLPPQAGGNSLGDVYKFFASDLANQTKQAKSNAVADASSRGVYYGTPLTGSEADIDTQYLRGMGQLQSGMYGNEQQNHLARLGMATNLSAMGSLNAPPNPGQMDFSGLGALFGSNSPTSGNNTQRQGPVISAPPVKSGEGYKPAKTTQS